MMPTSFRTRSVVHAVLFGPPTALTRENGMEIHHGVCEALGMDDFSFRYSSTAPEEEGDVRDKSKGFSIHLERPQGRGRFKILIDNHNIQNPIRLLQEYDWPPSREHISEDLNLVEETVFETLEGDWQRVLVETRVRGHMQASGESAVEYLRGRVLRIPDSAAEELESPISFLSVSYETAAGHPTETDQLKAPKREFKMEVLREDPRSLYVELMSQWPQLPTIGTKVGTVEVDARRIRGFEAPPSEYLDNCIEYLNRVAFPMFVESARES